MSYERMTEEEYLIFSAAELVTEVMQRNNISRAELARRMGKSRAYVTMLLSGERNVTLRTLARIGHALDCRFAIDIEDAT